MKPIHYFKHHVTFTPCYLYWLLALSLFPVYKVIIKRSLLISMKNLIQILAFR